MRNIQMKRILFFGLFLASGIIARAQMSVEEYISAYKDIAIEEMKRSGIPASITIAQGILETENGNSILVKKSNNHFGIKCKSNWTGPSVSHDDDAPGECFRVYNTAADSYRDHSNFLRGSNRYAFLFELAPNDYKGWAYGLKKAGYATNPKYPDILIRNIERYNLQQYDLDRNGNPVIDLAKQAELNEEPKEQVIKPVQYTEMNMKQNLASIKSGKTLFNGLKAIYVPAGTSLLAIATEYEIGLSDLLDYNDLKKDGLLKDEQWIFLQKKKKEGNRDSYTTSGNESLYWIAQMNAIQLGSLMDFNGLPETAVLRPGTRIWLRPGHASIINVSKTSLTRIHQVKQKEGLYSISRQYNVSVQDLRDWNQLSSDDLKPGQEIIIAK
jgi:LysM repeat protein